MRPPSPEAVARLRALAPEGSAPWGMAELARRGRVQISAAPPGQEVRTRLVAPRGAAVATVFVRSDELDDAIALLDACARHLGDPGPHGRAAVADAAVGQAREGQLDPGPVPAGRDHLAHAIDTWSPADDPLRVRMAALQAAWRSDTPVHDGPGLRAALRVHLERDGGDARHGPHTRMPSDLLAHLDRHSEVFQTPDGTWLPRQRLPRPTIDDVVPAVIERVRRGARIGLCGPAAAGKSTLAVGLIAALQAHGHTVVHVAGDRLTFEGPRFRYVQHATHRDDIVEGPGLYDDHAIAESLEAAGHATVVIDGVYLGLSPMVARRLDHTILVVADPARRLHDKQLRDTAPGSNRTIDVVTDLARKLYREDRDTVPRLAAAADWIVDRTVSAPTQ